MQNMLVLKVHMNIFSNCKYLLPFFPFFVFVYFLMTYLVSSFCLPVKRTNGFRDGRNFLSISKHMCVICSLLYFKKYRCTTYLFILMLFPCYLSSFYELFSQLLVAFSSLFFFRKFTYCCSSDIRVYLNFYKSPVLHITPCSSGLIRKKGYTLTSEAEV